MAAISNKLTSSSRQAQLCEKWMIYVEGVRMRPRKKDYMPRYEMPDDISSAGMLREYLKAHPPYPAIPHLFVNSDHWMRDELYKLYLTFRHCDRDVDVGAVLLGQEGHCGVGLFARTNVPKGEVLRLYARLEALPKATQEENELTHHSLIMSEGSQTSFPREGGVIVTVDTMTILHNSLSGPGSYINGAHLKCSNVYWPNLTWEGRHKLVVNKAKKDESFQFHPYPYSDSQYSIVKARQDISIGEQLLVCYKQDPVPEHFLCPKCSLAMTDSKKK